MFTRAMRSETGSRRIRVAALVVYVATLAVGCGDPSQDAGGDARVEPPVSEPVGETSPITTPTTSPSTSSSTSSTEPGDQGYAPLYRAVTTVIETPDHGPLLCLGGEKDSAPPICGDVPVIGLDWNTVSGAQTLGNITWIEQAFVTGTYDGTALTLTEPPRKATDAERVAQYPGDGPAPCPEPAGGWAAQGAGFAPGSAYNEYMSKLSPLAASQPDFGGMWLAFIGDSSTFSLDQYPDRVIPVVLFTGDLARHEAELRAVWPGALCVATSAMTADKMQSIADKVTQDEQGPDSLDPVMRATANVAYSRGAIEVYVPAVTASLQAAFDARYGGGIVTLRGALQPVTSN